MTEQDYERMVERLEQRYTDRLLETAIDVLDAYAPKFGDDTDSLLDEAKAAVEVIMFHSTDWEPVEATDISDIALDHVNRAWSQRRAWSEA
jgi:hypothetical protein